MRTGEPNRSPSASDRDAVGTGGLTALVAGAGVVSYRAYDNGVLDTGDGRLTRREVTGATIRGPLAVSSNPTQVASAGLGPGWTSIATPCVAPLEIPLIRDSSRVRYAVCAS